MPVVPPSGQILSGGIISNALQRPKRFFGAARNMKKAARDDYRNRTNRHRLAHGHYFRRVQSTGNSEIISTPTHDKRLFPAIDLQRSGTRKEELLSAKKISVVSGSCVAC